MSRITRKPRQAVRRSAEYKTRLSESSSLLAEKMEEKRPGLEFMDAQMMAKEHPDTFSAPDEIALRCVTAGAYVKVCVDKERFWVLVTAVTPTTITGTINNDLVYTRYHGLRFEDLITFEPRHVFNIYDDCTQEARAKHD